jgi:aspartate-semialdehyde dehydrogenase
MRNFPAGELRLFASDDSVGEFLEVDDQSLPVGQLTADAFHSVDLVIFATPADVSELWCPRALETGAVCIDLSAAGRLDKTRPLLVAGVNDEAFSSGVCSSPASSVVALALLLGALRKAGEVKRLLVTMVTPASARGMRGLDELRKQTGELLNGRPAQNKIFPAQLAFNGLPSGDDSREVSLKAELGKILNDTDLAVRINQLELPLFYGEGGFVRVDFATPVVREQVVDWLTATSGIDLQDQGDYPTLLDAVGCDDVLVRLHSSDETTTTLDFWYVVDNIVRCGAGNAVRLAEKILVEVRHQQG